MSVELEFDKRITVLEKSMEWAQGSIQRIDQNIEIIKSGQLQMIERLMDYKTETNGQISSLQSRTDAKFSSLQAHTDERISSLQAHTDERISSLQARTDERFSSLQSRTDERFSSLQAHTDEKFIAVHAQFTEVHKEIAGIHRAISIQTKWLLAVILSAATLVSILQPLMMKLIN